MPSLEALSLTPDEIDDLLYFTRVNEVQGLQDGIQELSERYNSPRRNVLLAAVDPETGNTILHYCSANGFVDLLRILLNELGWSQSVEVEYAADGEKKQAVAMINSANKEGNTPLHWAAYNGQLEVVKMLVAAGADSWIKNAAGQLAMYEAERANRTEVAHLLLQAGMEEARKGRSGELPSAKDIGFADPNGQASSANGNQEVDGIADLNISEPSQSG